MAFPTSTFHSVYISTWEVQIISNVDIVSTFHSVYISTVDVRYIQGGDTQSTFHSVYISTYIPFADSYIQFHLHSTLFILVQDFRISPFCNYPIYIPLCLY